MAARAEWEALEGLHPACNITPTPPVVKHHLAVHQQFDSVGLLARESQDKHLGSSSRGWDGSTTVIQGGGRGEGRVIAENHGKQRISSRLYLPWSLTQLITYSVSGLPPRRDCTS